VSKWRGGLHLLSSFVFIGGLSLASRGDAQAIFTSDQGILLIPALSVDGGDDRFAVRLRQNGGAGALRLGSEFLIDEIAAGDVAQRPKVNYDTRTGTVYLPETLSTGAPAGLRHWTLLQRSTSDIRGSSFKVVGLGEVSAPWTGTALLFERGNDREGQCLYGGEKLQIGFDRDGNGRLDAGEIGTTVPVCHGMPGAQGPMGREGPPGGVGPAGPAGPAGAAGAAGPGVAAGGSTGQVLAKNSNTNYDTKWVSLPAPSVVRQVNDSVPPVNPLTVACGAGKTALGGGCSGSNTLVTSAPLCGEVLCSNGAVADGWQCEASAGGSVDEAYVICQ